MMASLLGLSSPSSGMKIRSLLANMLVWLCITCTKGFVAPRPDLDTVSPRSREVREGSGTL